MSRYVRIAFALSIAGLLLERCLARYTQPQTHAPVPPPKPTVRSSVDLAKLEVEVCPGAEVRAGQTIGHQAGCSMVAHLPPRRLRQGRRVLQGQIPGAQGHEAGRRPREPRGSGARDQQLPGNEGRDGQRGPGGWRHQDRATAPHRPQTDKPQEGRRVGPPTRSQDTEDSPRRSCWSARLQGPAAGGLRE